MSVTFVATSAVAAAAGGGDLTVTPPATQTGDIMLLAVTKHDTVLTSMPAGWTLQVSSATLDLAVSGQIWWKRAVGAEAAFTFTNPGTTQTVVRLSVYRGCQKNISPINFFSGIANAASTLCTIDLTTTQPGAMVVFTNHIVANTTGFSNFFVRRTNGNPRLRERFLQNGDNIGSGANKTFLDLSDVDQALPVSGFLSAVISASTQNVALVVVLRPELAIITVTGKIGRSPSKVVLGTI